MSLSGSGAISSASKTPGNRAADLTPRLPPFVKLITPGGELRPVGALAALHPLELRQRCAASLGDVGGYRQALRLQAMAGASLAIGGDAQVADEAGRGRNRSLSL